MSLSAPVSEQKKRSRPARLDCLLQILCTASGHSLTQFEFVEHLPCAKHVLGIPGIAGDKADTALALWGLQSKDDRQHFLKSWW